MRAASVVAILAGLLVLAGAIAAGLRTRLYDSTIMKVVGATRAQIALASLPFIGQLGTFIVHGNAAAPVDAYRSLIGASSP